MTDVFDKEKRSEVMSRIKSSGNKSTELKLIALFKECSITGWRRGSKITGRPDFIFPKRKIAVFTDGCFWHGHECQKRMPSTNPDFWLKKTSRNISRDKEVSDALSVKGWKVVRIWECELRDKNIDLAKKKIKCLKKSAHGSFCIDFVNHFLLNFIRKPHKRKQMQCFKKRFCRFFLCR